MFDWAPAAKRHLDTGFVLPANVAITRIDELRGPACPPIPRIEELRLQAPEEAFASRIVLRTGFLTGIGRALLH